MLVYMFGLSLLFEYLKKKETYKKGFLENKTSCCYYMYRQNNTAILCLPTVIECQTVKIISIHSMLFIKCFFLQSLTDNFSFAVIIIEFFIYSASPNTSTFMYTYHLHIPLKSEIFTFTRDPENPHYSPICYNRMSRQGKCKKSERIYLKSL